MKYLAGLLAVVAIGCLSFLSLYTSAFSPYKTEPSVHPLLQMQGKKADKPKLIKVGERIYQAFAYDFSNVFYIEGDDGVIVIDSGWSPDAARKSLADFRKISDKPIVALIYSHGHNDHLGGARVFVNENPQVPVKIYASGKWPEQYGHFNGALTPHMMMRGAAQLGALLPDGDRGRVNIGVGKMRVNKVEIDFVSPTEDISETTELSIAGVRMELIPLASETIDQMLIWFPDDKVMYAADVAAGAVPILSTPRNEPDRSPVGFIDSIELMMEKPLQHLIAGHSLPNLGEDKAREALSVQRDAAQFIYDQTIRALNMNLGPKETAEFVQLPPHLANHPMLSEVYHRVPWLVRGLYSRYGGWFSGDSVDLNPLPKAEEAQRMLVLAGGIDSLLANAKNAFHQGDYQWAAQLANYMLAANIEEREAKAIKIGALRAMAYSSYSGNQRHYMLTDAMVLELGIGPELVRKAPKDISPYQSMPMRKLLRLMGPNLNPQSCLDKEMTLAIRLSGMNESHYVTVRRGVLHYQGVKAVNADVAIEMERSVLEKILAHHLSWEDALDKDIVVVDGKQEKLEEFLSFFDLYSV